MLGDSADMKQLARIAIVGGTVVVATAGAVLWRYAFPNPSVAAARHHVDAAPVRIAHVRRGRVEIWLSNAGTVQASNTVLLRPRIEGQIRTVAFREGQMVKRGELLFELDSLPFRAALAAAQAQRQRDASLLDNARIDLHRYQLLLSEDATSVQTRDTARATVRQLAAAVAYDGAQIKLARLTLSYALIRAPFSGRIGARLVDAGNVVHTTDPGGLAVINRIQPIYVNFSVPQSRLAELREADKRDQVPVTATPPGARTRTVRGKLIFIDNQVDPATGAVHCKAEFANRGLALWPGQYVTTSIRLRILPQALTVPTAAVQSGPDGPFTYVVSRDLIARRRAVRTLGVQDGRTLIASGLSGGERVVTNGQFRLDSATPVSIRRN